MDPCKLITILFAALLATAAPLAIADEAADAALAAESEAFCNSTVKEGQPTVPASVMAKVNEACALLEKDGPAAFPKFKGKGSPFIYEGTYIWIHTLDEAEMLMHPIKHKMVGNKLIGLKDTKGKRFFVVMNNLVKEKAEGWVEYLWPKPGSDDITRKISFVKRCKMSTGVDVVVGSGLYSFNNDDVAKLELH